MQIKEYTSVKEMSDNDIFLIDGNNGTRTINASDAANTLVEKVSSPNIMNALDIGNMSSFMNQVDWDPTGDYQKIMTDLSNYYHFRIDPWESLILGLNYKNGPNSKIIHRMIFRDEFLGNAVTDEQWEAIRSGRFDNLFLGDYWVIGGTIWRIVDFDYWLGTGDIPNNKHHLVIMPNDHITDKKQMNSVTESDKGYIGSELRSYLYSDVLPIITSAFPEDHLYSHRENLSNSVPNNDGTNIGYIWTNSTIEIPSAEMVYGYVPWMNTSENLDTTNCQLTIYRLHIGFMRLGINWWLRNTYGKTRYLISCVDGPCITAASTNMGVYPIPVFGIC